MKHFFLYLWAKYKFFVFVVLKPLGIWGVAVLAFIDGSSIAVPVDAVLAGYVWAQPHRMVLYCLVAALGSAAGSLVPFYIGRAGGELFLLKRVDRVRFEKLRDRFARQEFFAIAIPAMLPPPTPFKLFVFCAGVFEMHFTMFIAAVFSGRFLRFLIEAILVIRYGPEIVHVIAAAIHDHLHLTVFISSVLVLALAWIFGRQLVTAMRKPAA
jgi:membrane protein YqaA with SNARE-associated domain